jgi:ATP-dependent RNA helicase RhlB
MNNPAQITIMPEQKTAEGVAQSLFHVGRDEKFSLLLGLLRREGGERILIFSNTREEARRIEDRLNRNGWEARALTGDIEQRRRLKILTDFKEGRLPVLVATDVASRGLHIEGVSHVINWDLPQDAQDYVHRIGRTARAGAEGKAISLADEASALYLEPIEKFIGQKIAVEWADDDLFVSEVKPTAEERRRYADEKRARLDARRRQDGRRGDGARDRGRDSRQHGGRERPRPEPRGVGPETPTGTPMRDERPRDEPAASPRSPDDSQPGAPPRPRRPRRRPTGPRPEGLLLPRRRAGRAARL